MNQHVYASYWLCIVLKIEKALFFTEKFQKLKKIKKFFLKDYFFKYRLYAEFYAQNLFLVGLSSKLFVRSLRLLKKNINIAF
jgi:hypothetical protein